MQVYPKVLKYHPRIYVLLMMSTLLIHQHPWLKPIFQLQAEPACCSAWSFAAIFLSGTGWLTSVQENMPAKTKELPPTNPQKKKTNHAPPVSVGSSCTAPASSAVPLASASLLPSPAWPPRGATIKNASGKILESKDFLEFLFTPPKKKKISW